jgi:predicted regulator of Ras-like GTPase activity (Roadblock/LC7/MglB family)
MNKAGGFHSAVLTSSDGFPIAAAPVDRDSETMAAIVALFRGVSTQVQEQLNLAAIDEFTVRDGDYFRVVCRQLAVQQDALILAAIVPPGRPYRRVTNRAIKHIQQLLA